MQFRSANAGRGEQAKEEPYDRQLGGEGLTLATDLDVMVLPIGTDRGTRFRDTGVALCVLRPSLEIPRDEFRIHLADPL